MATRYIIKGDHVVLYYSKGSRNNRIQKSKRIPLPPGRKREQARLIEEALKEFAEDVKENAIPQKIPSFAAYCGDWLKIKERTLSPTTKKKYKEILQRYLLPEFGNLSIADITLLRATRLQSKLLDKLSPRTVKDISSLLKQLIKEAHEYEIIKENTLAKLKTPRIPQKEKKIYKELELPDVMQAMEKEPLDRQCALLFALLCGMRRSEIAGLNRSDIDTGSGRVTISKAYVYGENGAILKETKSNRIRSVTMPPILRNKIKELMLQTAPPDKIIKIKSDIPLFINMHGKRIFPTTITSWMVAFRKHNPELSHVTLHGLRHTNASMLMRQGIDIQTITNWLGHSRASISLDIYGHMMQDTQEEIIEAINKIAK